MPKRNGGISFLAVPETIAVYNFWIYICPFTAGFSARGAVAKLRSVYSNDVAPWGTFALDDRPIIQQLVEAAVFSEFHTDVKKILIEIVKDNLLAETNKANSLTQSINIYAAD